MPASDPESRELKCGSTAEVTTPLRGKRRKVIAYRSLTASQIRPQGPATELTLEFPPPRLNQQIGEELEHGFDEQRHFSHLKPHQPRRTANRDSSPGRVSFVHLVGSPG